MKRIAILSLAMLVAFWYVGSAHAQTATKDEAMAKCKEAAAMIKDKGLDATVKAVNDKSGPFVWKDSYVFIMDMDAKMLAHPIKPDLIGKTHMESKDSAGKLFFKEFVEMAKGKGEGWVDYMWPKPGEDKPVAKTAYIYRVPGQDLFVGAGVYK